MAVLLTGTILTAVLVGAHWYLYHRLVRDLIRAGTTARVIGSGLVACSLIIGLLAMIDAPEVGPFGPGVHTVESTVAKPWLVMVCTVIPLLLLLDLAHIVTTRLRRPHGSNARGLPRRAILRYALVLTALMIAVVVTNERITVNTTDRLQGADSEAIVLSLPFTGRWITQNSPANRVPSHGTSLFGSRYAIDFVAVDDLGRTAPITDWSTWFGTEPPRTLLCIRSTNHGPN